MIDDAEERGIIQPGSTLVEATAGNTGLGLALVAALKGYHLILVIPDKMSLEKIVHLRGLGVEVRITRSDVGKGHPAYYQDMAERIAREIGGFYVNQFSNPANPRTHETTTGPEIWRQMNERVDAVVCGVGSGGTITGLGRFFAAHAPNATMVLADPVGSVLADRVRSGKVVDAGSWLVEGIGEDFVPPNCDLRLVREAYSISDEESLTTARELLRREGIFAGSSSGTLVAAALRYCRDQRQAKRVVTLICDSGGKYLSKMFNDYWMQDHGYLRDRPTGDLRDVIARRADGGEVVTVSPEDTLKTALDRMKGVEVSQLPVLVGQRIVGLLDESDLLHALSKTPAVLLQPVREFMSTQLVTVSPTAPLDSLFPLFDRGLVALVCEEDRFLGLITRIDVVNHLRRVHG
jgi:cystathionine beta-synthase